jgi:hypothetical protein
MASYSAFVRTKVQLAPQLSIHGNGPQYSRYL